MCHKCRSLASAEDEEAHLVECADRAAGWRESPGISTVSTTVERALLLNGNARSSSQVKVLVDHPAASLANAFTRSCGRRYLLSSSASRFSLRILTTTWPRRVAMSSSNPHGRATSETAARGTCVQCAFRVSGIASAKKSSHRTPYPGPAVLASERISLMSVVIVVLSRLA